MRTCDESIVPTRVSWSSHLLNGVVESLRLRYPFVRVAVIGASVLGRPLYQMSIGRGPRRLGYNAAHHANEWITAPVLLKFLEQFACGVARGDRLWLRLYERFRLDVVPMVNPDGLEFT